MKQLTKDFVAELTKCCLESETILQICRQHLKFQYLYDESQKKVFKFIFDTYDVTNTTPTIGSIGQTYSTDQDVINFLSKVKKLTLTPDHTGVIISTFESFIKDSRFRLLYEKIGDLYNEGKQDKAIELLEKESSEIASFTLKDKMYTTVFRDFKIRQDKRQSNRDNILLEKLTFGIHELDDLTRGGFNKGTSVLIMGGSGKGKSTFLRWVGLCNARLGRRVVHFQAEGTEQECLDAYDAGWTSINTYDIELGTLPESKKDKIYKAQKDILLSGGEIYVYASESFDSMSINKCNEVLDDIENIHGHIDLVIFDYLEIFTVKGQYGSSEASERKRREEIANKITNIAIQRKCGTIAGTQAQDLPREKTDNEEFVMTRNHISEFKGCVKPFSYFLTINQTSDEYDSEIVRIYCDKFRKYRSGQTVKFFQSRENGRFYNAKKTLQYIYKK